MADTALIILEQPWWNVDCNPGQASVLPFFQGLERLVDNCKVYHATFNDRDSFTDALTHLVCNNRYERHLLYVAAHGKPRKVAAMHLSSLCAIIGGHARHCPIEGVIIGSCHAGIQVEMMKAAITDSSICWMMGYKGAVDWLTSTLIDVAVMENMLDLDEADREERDNIFLQFTDAIHRFNPTCAVATDRKERPMRLRETLSLVIQPRGRGRQPMDMAPALAEYNWVEATDGD